MRYSAKKVLIIAIAVLTVITATVFSGCDKALPEVNKPSQMNNELGEKAFGYMTKLASEGLSERTAGLQSEVDAAKYISEKMSGFGYEGVYNDSDIEGAQEFKATFKRFNGEEVKDATVHNVIFSKKSVAQTVKGEILLTCHYDNLFAEKSAASGSVWSSDGSYESGSGVAVLLTLAEELIDAELDYDITFAFFTCGSYFWKGAMNYVDNLDREGLDKIALAIDFSMSVGGDNWYIYSGETSTDYGAFLNACGGDTLSAVPKDRNIGQFTMTEDSVFVYTNAGMLSNNYFLMEKGVPTANFLSLNWEVNEHPLFTECKGKANVYHTSNDTLSNMVERIGEENIKSRLTAIIATALTAFDVSNSDALSSSLLSARSQLPDGISQNGKKAGLANIIIKVVLIAILLAVSYVVRNFIYRNKNRYFAPKTYAEGEEQTQNQQEPFADVDGSDKKDEKVLSEGDKNAEKSNFDDPFV